MANNRTITAANAILMLSVSGLFPTPQKIQGFSADDVFDTDNVETKETAMGVDGHLSVGWVAVSVRQNITLQADSLSNDFFEQWNRAEQNSREAFIATGTVLLPATNRKYQLTRGVLRGLVLLPALRRTIQPRRYTLEWESISAAPA